MIADVEMFLADASAFNAERDREALACTCGACQECDPLPGWCTACGEVECVCLTWEVR